MARDVVLMTTHDIGRRLRCYGHASVVSPHLDSLAAGGARFEMAFCTAPQCSPSRATLATGRYPHSNGVMGLAHPGFDWELDPAVPHLASVLGAAGFETHLFGGQHVSLHPERLGFSHYHGDKSGDAIAAGVEQAVRDVGGRRLYLEVNFEETHRPYPPPPAHPPDGLDLPAFLPDGTAAVEEMSALEEGIRLMDVAAGRVLDALARAGRADDAIVLFTTDHGMAMPRAKCTLYDPGIEVALLVRWPHGGVTPGALLPHMATNLDVMPTILDAAGLNQPPGVQGRSFLTLLRGERHEERDAIFVEKTFHSYYDPMRGIRTKTHKLIRNFETAFLVEVPGDIQAGAIFRADPTLYAKDRPSIVELYDLDQDPLETRNLAGQPAVSDVERALSEALWAWMRETEDPLLNGPVASPRYRLAMQA